MVGSSVSLTVWSFEFPETAPVNPWMVPGIRNPWCCVESMATTKCLVLGTQDMVSLDSNLYRRYWENSQGTEPISPGRISVFKANKRFLRWHFFANIKLQSTSNDRE